MNKLTRRDIRQRMADRQTVFDDVLPFGNGLQSELVPARNVLAQRDGLVVKRHFQPFAQVGQRDRYVIQRMDLDVLHINPQKALVQFNSEVVACVVKADVSHHFAQQLDVGRGFARGDPAANHLA